MINKVSRGMSVTGSVSPLRKQIVDYSRGTNVDVFCVQKHITMFEHAVIYTKPSVSPIVVGGEHTVILIRSV